jgi:excisionase family DNA binding protein
MNGRVDVSATPKDKAAPGPTKRLAEAADHLCVSQSYTRRLVAEGKLQAVRIGQRLVFRVEDLDRFLADNLTTAQPEPPVPAARPRRRQRAKAGVS